MGKKAGGGGRKPPKGQTKRPFKGSLKKRAKPGAGKSRGSVARRGPGRPTGPASAEDGRARIVAAALACFHDLGIERTRVADIAKRAGVDHSLLYYHFPEPDALNAEVVIRILDSLREFTQQSLEQGPQDAPRLLDRYLEAPYRWGRRNPVLASLWLYYYYLASHRDRFRGIAGDRRQAGRERITRILHQGMAEGRFRLARGWTPERLAFAIQAAVNGFCVQFFTEPGRDAEADVGDLRRMVGVLVYSQDVK